jgi:DNA-binding transcriptional ArsR family regulator
MADRQISWLRAVAHPVRLQMLSLLTGTEMSAAEVARELGISHANASYHLRTLYAAGQLVVTGEERIRGGVAKRYRYAVEQTLTLDAPDPSPRSADLVAHVHALSLELERRLGEVAPGTGQVMVDIETWVEPEVWGRASGLLREAARLLHQEARPPRTAGTRHVSFTGWGFRMRDESTDDA